MPEISVILPVYNEEKNIPLLFNALISAIKSYDYEVIAVNDGSKDLSWIKLTEIAEGNARIKAVNFIKNFGQTAAINAGIQQAAGDIVILIDSDLENDPGDIPRLIEKINEGYDVVSGWRQGRWKGQWIQRKLPSMAANKLISKISGVHLHDYGCTLKAYNKRVIKNVLLYGEMHRFIPVYAFWMGGRVGEIPVSYRPRMHGKSNYGIGRTFKVVLDLVLIKFLQKYMDKPIHFFGGAGLILFLGAFLAAAWAVYYKVAGLKTFIETPLPTICAFLIGTGIQMILIGIVSEMLMRTYYESQNKQPFIIKETINI